MKFHMDEKENYKKKIDKMKEDMARRNKEKKSKGEVIDSYYIVKIVMRW